MDTTKNISTEARVCEHCGRVIDDDEGFYTVNTSCDTEVWCEDCVDADAFTCEHCGDVYDLECANSVHVRGRRSEYIEYWCDDCAASAAMVCDECGNTFANNIEEYETWDGKYTTLCDSCFSDSWSYCEDCERIVNDDDVRWIDDRPYCPSCAEDRASDNLASYHHSYGHVFWIDENTCKTSYMLSDDEERLLYLGVELETDNNNTPAALADSIARAFGPDYFECKTDGSLSSEGVEIVSTPMTARAHLASDVWARVVDLVRACDGLSNDASSSCGLHIHGSRNALASHDTVYRLDRFFHRFADEFVRFSRRHGYELDWCRIGEDSLAGYASTSERKCAWRNAKRFENRYVAVNDRNADTVEIRLWKGSLNVETIRATIEMTAGLFMVADKVTDDYADLLTWRELVGLVRYELVRARLPYADLDAYLARRGL